MPAADSEVFGADPVGSKNTPVSGEAAVARKTKRAQTGIAERQVGAASLREPQERHELAGGVPTALIQPFHPMVMAIDAWSKAMQLWGFAFAHPDTRNQSPPFDPPQGDNRFRDPMWRSHPWDLAMQAQLATEKIWASMSPSVVAPGKAATALSRFAIDRTIRSAAPSNFLWSNPVAVAKLGRTAGKSAVAGAWNWMNDATSLIAGRNPLDERGYAVGREIASTPGKVVFRNELIELIQYSPATPDVWREPVLIVPAWIMKFYILDLSPHNSLIRYLVHQGFTVFCVSWKNPTAADRDLTLDDYRSRGVMKAIDVVNDIAPKAKIHGVGYCAGGTILSIAAAAMARDDDGRLGSLTLLAAQTDFENPGEVATFLHEPQVAVLETVMNIQGLLDPRQMAAVFYALRADDLVWAPYVRRYLLGETRDGSDLDAWFHDGTRLPAAMHGQYLRWLYLENRLSKGTLRAGGKRVSLADVRVPLFAVGADRDHIAPWRSVFRGASLMKGDHTLLLSGGGHNSAIVSPPGKAHAFYRVHTADGGDAQKDRFSWTETGPRQSGSWWPEWLGWLNRHSSPDRIRPPQMGGPGGSRRQLESAPGLFVHEA